MKNHEISPNIAKICLKSRKIDDFSPKFHESLKYFMKFKHQKKTLFCQKMMFFDIFSSFILIEISWKNDVFHWFSFKLLQPRTRLWDSLQPSSALHSWFKQIIKLRHSWLDSAYGPASSLISLIKFAQLLNEIHGFSFNFARLLRKAASSDSWLSFIKFAHRWHPACLSLVD